MTFKRWTCGPVTVDFNPMPRFMGGRKTLAPSYLRVWWRRRYAFDMALPKFGRA